MEDAVDILSRIALFADLSEHELRELAGHTARRHFRVGERLFSEGDPCQGFFVLESGEVKVFKTAISGREQVLTMEHAGNSIAEVPVFDGGQYPASAVAVSDATLLFVSKRDFRTLVLDNPEVGLKVLKAVGSRLRRLVALIEELSFTTVRGRLVMLLVRLLREDGRATERGHEITLPPNQELASQIGTVKELVSRNLGRLQAEGLIRIDGKNVIVADIDALAGSIEGDLH